MNKISPIIRKIFFVAAIVFLFANTNAQVQVPVGPQSTTYTSMVRGYYFTAPTTFSLVGLYIPTDATPSGPQAVEVVRFTAGPPPAWPGTTNSFVSLFYQAAWIPNTTIPCNITINAGDVIGVYGARTASCVNSYDGANFATTICGQPATLTRSGMQACLASMQMQNICAEASFNIGRIFMYTTCCNMAPPINPPTTVTGPNNVCSGQSGQYICSPVTGTGTVTYSWTAPTGTIITGQGNDTINVTYGTTTGQICVYSIDGCDTSNVPTCFTVTITPTPVALVVPSAPSICTGSNTVLTASGGTNYAWSPGTGLSSTTASNPTANPTVTTTYTVTVSNGICVDTQAVTVTVNPLPPVSAGLDVSICNSLSTTLNASGATSYVWSPSTGLSSSVVSNPTANPTVTTTY